MPLMWKGKPFLQLFGGLENSAGIQRDWAEGRRLQEGTPREERLDVLHAGAHLDDRMTALALSPAMAPEEGFAPTRSPPCPSRDVATLIPHPTLGLYISSLQLD